jgi:hypothetical protein
MGSKSGEWGGLEGEAPFMLFLVKNVFVKKGNVRRCFVVIK